jgi:hypothetical protein
MGQIVPDVPSALNPPPKKHKEKVINFKPCRLATFKNNTKRKVKATRFKESSVSFRNLKFIFRVLYNEWNQYWNVLLRVHWKKLL